MALDNAQFIAELSITDPTGTDPLSQGDDQIRTTKRATQQSFPNIDAAVTLTAAQLNDVALKSDAQTITGIWTFSTVPIMAGIDADTDFTLRVAGGVAAETALVARANSAVELYHNNIKRLETAVSGEVRIFSNGSTDAEARSLSLSHQDGFERAHFGHFSNDILDILNRINGGSARIRIIDTGGTARTIIDGDSDGITRLRAVTNLSLEVASGEIAINAIANGAVESFHDNIKRLATAAAGITEFFSDGNASTEAGNLQLSLQNGTPRARMGFDIGDTFQIRNLTVGANLTLFAQNVADVQRTILLGNPDDITRLRAATGLNLEVNNGEAAITALANGEVQLFHNNIKTAETAPVTSGGLLADNQATGAGLERVLTVSDLDPLEQTIYTIRVDNDGTPTVLKSSANASGWTVAAGTLGHIIITHSLGLASINDLIVVATATREATGNTLGGDTMICEVQEETVNGFTVAVVQVDSSRVEFGAINVIAHQI